MLVRGLGILDQRGGQLVVALAKGHDGAIGTSKQRTRKRKRRMITSMVISQCLSIALYLREEG
jgi:hypothetical protein